MKALSLALLASIFAITGYTQSKTIDERIYKLQYDETWSIDTEDADYDPDTYFAIESPEDAIFLLFIFKENWNLGKCFRPISIHSRKG